MIFFLFTHRESHSFLSHCEEFRWIQSTVRVLLLETTFKYGKYTTTWNSQMVGPFPSRCDPSPLSGRPPNIWLFPFLYSTTPPHPLWPTFNLRYLDFELRGTVQTENLGRLLNHLLHFHVNCRYGLSRTICCKQSSHNLHIYSASSDSAGGGLPDASQLRWLLAAVDAHDLMCRLSDVNLPSNIWSFSRKDDKSMLTRLRFRGISVTAQGSWTDPSVSLLLWICQLLKQNVFLISTRWLLLIHAWVVL